MQQLAMSRTQLGAADFDALIGPHLEAGYRTALAILRNPDEAHDAVQESAFKAWRKLAQLHEGAGPQRRRRQDSRLPGSEEAAPRTGDGFDGRHALRDSNGF